MTLFNFAVFMEENVSRLQTLLRDPKSRSTVIPSKEDLRELPSWVTERKETKITDRCKESSTREGSSSVV